MVPSSVSIPHTLAEAGLTSRAVIVGALLIAFGFFNFIFGFDKFIEAAKEAYTGKKKPPPQPKAAPKSEAQSNSEKARDLTRQMDACKYAVILVV